MSLVTYLSCTHKFMSNNTIESIHADEDITKSASLCDPPKCSSSKEGCYISQLFVHQTALQKILHLSCSHFIYVNLNAITAIFS